MIKSEQINELASALCKFQASMTPVKKDAENPFFHSNYADLESIWEGARLKLSAVGLSVSQLVCSLNGEVGCETMLLHSSGQFISSYFTLPTVKKDPQAFGSAITYARRYGLAAILSIATTDDDANSAMPDDASIPEKAAEKPKRGKKKDLPPQTLDNYLSEIEKASTVNDIIVIKKNFTELFDKSEDKEKNIMKNAAEDRKSVILQEMEANNA